MVFVGIDWAEAHHDVCLLDEQGKQLGKRRGPEGLEGTRPLHGLGAEQAGGPGEVGVGVAFVERAPPPYRGGWAPRAKIVAARGGGGGERTREARAAQTQACLRPPQIQPPPLLTRAYGSSVIALVRLLRHLNQE